MKAGGVLSSPRLLVMLPLGFASGLPLKLTDETLATWMAQTGSDPSTIGWMALVGIPYSLKFLWAPLLDRFNPAPADRAMGRRRAWALITQIALAILIATLGLVGPGENAALFAGVALAVAFFSASQDITVDAYRCDILKPKELGLGAAIFVGGYRIALLMAGGAALMLSHPLGWALTYCVMGALMLIGAIVSWFAPDPEEPPAQPKSLRQAFWEPIREFLARPLVWAILALIVFYKLGDAFAARQNATLLTQKLHFVPWEIGLISQTIGPIALILGAIVGGLIITRVDLLRALLWFALFQAITNLGFLVLMEIGRDRTTLGVVIGLENFAQGMGATAFVALLMCLCDLRFSATQYALLTAMSSLSRVLIGPVTGWVVSHLGWGPFFWLSVLVSIPGIVLLWLCRHVIRARVNQA